VAINGRIQREGEVVHLVAQQLFDLSVDLSGLAERDGAFHLPTGRGMSSPMALLEVRILAKKRRQGFGRGICSCRIFKSIR
jgi:hypothetical protein